MLRKSFAIFASTIAISASFAQPTETEPEFRHAMFVDGDRSLASRVKFPRGEGDTEVKVVCRGHATAKGRLDDVSCSSPNDPDRDYVKAVTRRVKSSRLNPALVDGEPRDVDIQFTVNFLRTGEEETISVVYHNGHNVERLGNDYISAQRYSSHMWPVPCKSWGDTDVLIEAATIDASGAPREVNAMSTRTRMREGCGAALKRQLEAGQWIPAMKDGEYVESVWVSLIMLNTVEVIF